MFLSFCMYYKIDIHSISVNNPISFIECLASSLSTATILTYVSAIKAKPCQLGLVFTSWSHNRVGLMLRSCSRMVIHQPGVKQVLTPQTLAQLIDLTSSLLHGIIYKTLFLLAFHGFFRICNLLPSSKSAPQPGRHISRGDVSIAPPGITVFLKWSKTLQASKDTRSIPLAEIPGSPAGSHADQPSLPCS